MDQDYSEHRNVEYSNAVTYELAQKPGMLSPLVGSTAPYSGNAKARIENRFDELEMEDQKGRNEDTNLTDLDSSTRWIKAGPAADTAVLIDKNDQKVTQVPLNSPIANRIALAARRYHDRKWLEGYVGTAYTGEDGDTAVPFPAGNHIAVGGTGLTKAKLLALREAMLGKDVDFDEERPIILIGPKQETDLFNISEYVDADYTPGWALARGEIKPWLGFRFVTINFDSKRGYGQLGTTLLRNGNTRLLPAFQPSGLHRGVWTEFFGHIDMRADKKLNTQIYGEARSAVTRVNEDKCFLLEVNEPVV